MATSKANDVRIANLEPARTPERTDPSQSSLVSRFLHDQVVGTGIWLKLAWSRIWSNCVPKGLRKRLSAPLYSVENMRAPGFIIRLLTEGL